MRFYSAVIFCGRCRALEPYTVPRHAATCIRADVICIPRFHAGRKIIVTSFSCLRQQLLALILVVKTALQSRATIPPQTRTIPLIATSAQAAVSLALHKRHRSPLYCRRIKCKKIIMPNMLSPIGHGLRCLCFRPALADGSNITVVINNAINKTFILKVIILTR